MACKGGDILPKYINKRRRRMVVRFYPWWYCSMCRRGYREDRTDYGRERGVVYVYCPKCGAALGYRSDEPNIVLGGSSETQGVIVGDN